MTRALGMATLAALAVAAAGCGEKKEVLGTERSAPPPQQRSEPADAPPPAGTRLKVVDSRFGPVVADRRGEALYLFDKEKSARSECYGECAEAWPPALAKGRPVAGDGASQRLLGTTERRDGKRQLTYRGHPLYYYVGDSPGKILCQNVDEFGGLWLVVKPDGQPVTS